MLTRSGWGAVALAGVAFVLGRVFGIIELFVLGMGIVAALVVAVGAMSVRTPHLSVRRRVEPTTLHAGEAARIDVQVSNGGSRRSPVLQLWEPVTRTNDLGGGGATMQLAPLRPGERSTTAYRLPTQQRGLVRIGPMRARRRDVLGLASKEVMLAGGVAEVLVMPPHTPLAFASGTAGGRLGDQVRLLAHGQSGNEFHSLREYVPGDDLRRISWKASARSPELVVKETALEGLRRCTVVLDTGAWDDPDAFERAVSVTAGIITGAAEAGLISRVVAPDTDLRGPDVSAVALRWLATVAAGDAGDAVLPPMRGVEGLGVLLVVSASPDSAIVTAVRAAMAPDDTLVAVAIERATGSGRSARFVVDATSDDALARSWADLTGDGARGARLPSAYRSTARAAAAGVEM